MKRWQLIKHLEKHECELLREGSKHSRWWNPKLGTRTVVPRHTKIDNVLAKKICKQLEIPHL